MKLELLRVEVDKDIRFVYRHKDQEIIRGIEMPDTIDLGEFRDDQAFGRLVEYCGVMYSVYLFGLEFFDEVHVPFPLSSQAITFFENTFTKGLAEFKYVNGINPSRPVKVVASQANNEPVNALGPSESALVMNGGGKDGAVGMELARAVVDDVAWFSLNSTPSRERIVAASGVEEYITAERITDDAVSSGAQYQGHKPMSAYVGLVGVLFAYITKKKYVIVSNERSANYANLVVEGFPINHQYSKSAEFEKELQTLLNGEGYSQQYFSILRPLYEVQIVQIFTKLSQYHQDFLSCNVGSSKDYWCMKCAKCAFIVASFYALDAVAAEKIWGRAEDVINTAELQKEIIELTNPDVKPFECIGTTEENIFVIRQLLESGILQIGNEEDTARLEQYLSEHSEDVMDVTKLNMDDVAFPETVHAKLVERLTELLGAAKDGQR